MARSLVPVFSLAVLMAACSHNTSTAGSTIEPGAPSASAADAGRGGRGPGRGGPGGPRGFRGDQALLRNITLSADQQQRIDTIRARYRTQMEQMRQQSGGDRDAMRGQMRTMMEKQQAEIRDVLTPDQQRQFDQNVADMRSRMERGGGRPGGAPLQ
jgi:Spy/CpxP family protein refolding chaperone